MATDTGKLRPASDSLPRLDHVQSHLPPRVRPLVEDLLRAETNAQIAVRLGSGWTRRQVEYATETIKMTFLPDGMDLGPTATVYARVRALRIAVGLDSCWCDD